MFNAKIPAFLTFLICVTGTGVASADWADKVRAFSLSPSSENSLCTDNFFQSVRNLKSMGANTLSIVVPYWSPTLTSSHIEPYRRTPSDEALTCGINYVKSQGLNFGLNLVVEVPGWRANLDPENRDQWFPQMGNIAIKYARDFAAPLGAAHMSLGTEMFMLVSNNYDSNNAAAPGRYRWPEIVADVRSNYGGIITYSAQHSGNRSAVFDDNDLMSHVDILGFSAYFPLFATDQSGLLQEWAYGKNLFVSELGYRPCEFAFNRPYDSRAECEYDGEVQATAWNAMLLFFRDKTYLNGMIGGWAWDDDPTVGGAGDTGYSPWNKPAANTFRSYWPLIEGAESSMESFVFSRTDTNEYRWIQGSQNVWISEACAARLGGATSFGDWSRLNTIAPDFDSAANPCDGHSPEPVTPSEPSTGFVFSRTDASEFRWVSGVNNIWIDESCATRLGGATQSGTWGELNAIAPGFDLASDPCSATAPVGGSPTETGYVFSRTDTNEFRWVVGNNNIWISESCAINLGGATEFGTWSDLNALASGFDLAVSPCNGPNPSNSGSGPDTTSGFVFSRTDTNEFRWVVGSQNTWISESCAISLGGATSSGSWVDLNLIAPEFDAAVNPCL